MPRVRRWVARSFVVSAAPMVEYISRFARTVVLSRLLDPTEFGTTVAIGILLGLVALVTDVSLDKFVIQSSKNDLHTLGAAHLLSITRGALVALVVLAAAPVGAMLFDVPNATGSFAIAALCPFIASFNHLHIKQVQRNYVYGPESIAQVISQICAFVSVIPAVHFFQDHRAIVASYLVESIVYAAASHVLASSPYVLRADRETLIAALAYGLPLMLNGLGLAMLAQLDRLIVGSWLGVAVLANYTVILTISVLPMGLVLRIFSPIAFSVMVAQKNHYSVQDNRQSLLIFASGLLSVLYAGFVAISLDWLTPAIFGRSFQVESSIHMLLTIIVFLRLLRFTAPTIFLLASERTKELAFSNLSSGIGIACSVVFIRFWPGVPSVLIGLMIGDFLALVLFFGLLYKKAPALRHLMVADIATAFISMGMILVALYLRPAPTLYQRGLVFIVGSVGLAVQLALALRYHNLRSVLLRPDV